MVQGENVVEMPEVALADFIESEEGSVRSKVQLQVDEILIKSCMKIYGNNQTKVAEVLGINRGTLRKKMKQLGMLH
jgi:Fis family transcriptional regulator